MQALSIMLAASTPLGVVFLVLGTLFAIFTVYLLLLTVAAFFYPIRKKPSSEKLASRIVVLIPAHNESTHIQRCVDSLQSQTYPAPLFGVVVIADNCTDDTADVARGAGAKVLERDEPNARGKGKALRWAMDQLLAREDAPDAIVVVDADSNAVPEFLSILVSRYEAGALVVQGESLLEEDGSPATALRIAAFLLVNRTRPTGRAVLGLPCHLAGNGMLFDAGVLRDHPWDAYSSTEDAEYAINLRKVGIAPVFARGAILMSPAAPTEAAAETQQLRWEGGKIHLARTQVPALVSAAFKQRSSIILDLALDLATPPLGLLAAAISAGTVLSGAGMLAGVVPTWGLAPWLTCVVALTLYVFLGLIAAEAPASSYRALFQAPRLVAGKLTRAKSLFGFKGDTWVRTERSSTVLDDPESEDSPAEREASK